MGRKEVVGSWYNSGYHGHFRSKARLDFINEYRNTARPTPPKTFNRRTQELGAKHPFSHHDNKHSFQNDALYFEQGLGRRRFRNKQTKWDSSLLSWMPSKNDWSPGTPMKSLYKVTYRGVPQQQIKQQIIDRPKTSYDIDPHTTTYRYCHGIDNPHKVLVAATPTGHAIDAANNSDLIGLPTPVNRKMRSTLEGGRDSVASCMTWHTPRPPSGGSRRYNRPQVPAATQLVPPKSHTAPQSVHFDTRSVGAGCDLVGDAPVNRPGVGSPISIATAPADLAE